jgi:hypothetical protein
MQTHSFEASTVGGCWIHVTCGCGVWSAGPFLELKAAVDAYGEHRAETANVRPGTVVQVTAYAPDAFADRVVGDDPQGYKFIILEFAEVTDSSWRQINTEMAKALEWHGWHLHTQTA